MIIIISIFLVEDPGQARGPEGLGVCVGAGALGAPRPGSRLRPIAADFLWGPEARNYPLNIHPQTVFGVLKPIFRRNTKREEVFNPVSGDERSWEVVESYEYPAKADTRSEDERLEDELNYYVRQLAWDKRNEEDPDLGICFELEELMRFERISGITTDCTRIREVLCGLTDMAVNFKEGQVYVVIDEDGSESNLSGYLSDVDECYDVEL